MKLFKKLLPIAAVASTAAIVAPVVTSCGSTVSFSSKFTEDGPEKKYEPKVKPFVATESMDNTKATETYFNEINKNKLIFADDWMATNYILIADIPTINDKTPVSGFGSISVSISKVDVEGKRLTGKFSYKNDCELSEDKQTVAIKCSYSCTFTNLQFKMEWDSSNGYWWFDHVDYSELEKDPNWEVRENIKWEMTYKTPSGTQKSESEATFISNKDEDEGYWSGDIDFHSNYFKDVESK